MKLFLPGFLGVWVLLAPGLRAGSLESALRAREWIGPGVPARLLRIRNESAGHSRYPAEFYGLVITFGDIVWLYTPFDGTQNLTSRRGQLPVDDAQLATLLRAVEPGLASFTDETARARPAVRLPLEPPNSCFLACLAQWRELQQGRAPPARARLLACYRPGGESGHMLLEFWREGRRYIFDPDRPGAAVEISPRIGEEPLAAAVAALEPRWHVRPVKAVSLELPVATQEPGILVAREPAPAVPART